MYEILRCAQNDSHELNTHITRGILSHPMALLKPNIVV